nr:GNAT family protein [Paenibacillus glycinis]
MNAVIGYIRARYPQSECLNLTVYPDNAAARKLYEKCGFKQTGEVHDGELVYRLVLRPGSSGSQ